MKRKNELKLPTFLVDQTRVSANIQKILRKTQKTNILLRPHFKTHQSAKVGDIFRDAGIDSITVSSVTMAEYFVDHGWKNITIAFPFNLPEIDELNALAEKISINIVIISTETLHFLGSHLKNKVGFFIKIENGYHRSSLLSQDDEIECIILQSKQYSSLNFRGFMAHSGNNYHVENISEIKQNYLQTVEVLNQLKAKYLSDFPDIQVSMGDTPSVSVLDNFGDVDELRPGNFVYYDAMQYAIGSCQLNEIAVAVAAPIVHKHKGTNELVLYSGAVHLSKESAIINGKNSYGLAAHLNENLTWTPDEQGNIHSTSQEHAVMKVSPETFERYKIGDFIGILPVHSCLTADIFRNLDTLYV